MDRQWMKEQLETFAELALRYNHSKKSSGGYVGDQALNDELHRTEPTIKKILQLLEPGLDEKIELDTMAGELLARNEVLRGLGILASMDDWDTRLTPESPVLLADRLHPWAWRAAMSLWETGHYRAALQAAATNINHHLQALSGRKDLSDLKLAQELFSDYPPAEGKPRLRWPGDPTDEEFKSMQAGLRNYASGVFACVRNRATHDVGEYSEQFGLEQLAALSLLCVWIEKCSLVEAVALPENDLVKSD